MCLILLCNSLPKRPKRSHNERLKIHNKHNIRLANEVKSLTVIMPLLGGPPRLVERGPARYSGRIDTDPEHHRRSVVVVGSDSVKSRGIVGIEPAITFFELDPLPPRRQNVIRNGGREQARSEGVLAD